MLYIVQWLGNTSEGGVKYNFLFSLQANVFSSCKTEMYRNNYINLKCSYISSQDVLLKSVEQALLRINLLQKVKNRNKIWESMAAKCGE